MSRPVLCACGCGTPLQRRPGAGRQPLYVDAAHRTRAYRSRRARRLEAAELESWGPSPPLGDLTMGSGSVTAQIERAVLEARAIGFAFTRLATAAPDAVAWRCERVGKAIIQALGESFEGVI